jgi:hypothetical protein
VQLGEQPRQAFAETGARPQAQRGALGGGGVTAAFARSAAASTARASGRNRCPASVSATRRVERSTSVTPNSASRRRSCWLTAGWTTCSRSAARPKRKRVVLRWTSQGRTRAGDDYENDCIGVFTVRDGRIQHVREYMDTRYAGPVAFAD